MRHGLPFCWWFLRLKDLKADQQVPSHCQVVRILLNGGLTNSGANKSTRRLVSIDRVFFTLQSVFTLRRPSRWVSYVSPLDLREVHMKWGIGTHWWVSLVWRYSCFLIKTSLTQLGFRALSPQTDVFLAAPNLFYVLEHQQSTNKSLDQIFRFLDEHPKMS